MMNATPLTTLTLHYSCQRAHKERWLKELAELLAFPTISALPEHRRDILAAASWLQRHLARIGLHHATILPGPNNGHPSVYADWLFAPGQPTILLYGHYDVQPVDPLVEWHSPPFQATLVGQNFFARGASDDKGQLFIHLKALESYLATVGALPINIKVWLEGEEEINSPNLSVLLQREAMRLRSDAILISDTEMLGHGRPSIIYSLRGNLGFDVALKGPRHDLHSGRYGGAVHNPIQALCEIIAGLHDQRGRVSIPGFYTHVHELREDERQELRCGTPADEKIIKDLDLPKGWGEAGYSLFERITIRPAITVSGISGGYTGSGTKSSIPSRAIAHMSVRLVPFQEPAEIGRLLHKYFAAATPSTVQARIKIRGGSSPVIVSRNNLVVSAAIRAIYQTWGVPPIFTRSGGTIPLVAQLRRYLPMPAILLGFGLPDDDIHAPNEKMSLLNFFKGIETVIRFLGENRL